MGSGWWCIGRGERGWPLYRSPRFNILKRYALYNLILTFNLSLPHAQIRAQILLGKTLSVMLYVINAGWWNSFWYCQDERLRGGMWRIAATRAEETTRSQIRQCSTQNCRKFHFGYYNLLLFFIFRKLFGALLKESELSYSELWAGIRLTRIIYVRYSFLCSCRILLRLSKMMISRPSRACYKKRERLPYLSMQEKQMRYIYKFTLCKLFLD